MLLDSQWAPLQRKSVFPYDGGVTANMPGEEADAIRWGIDDLLPEKLDENWAFEAEPSSSCGICWPQAHKPLMKWGNNLSFEINVGQLEAGGKIETKPVINAYGLFPHWNDFRNFAQRRYQREPAQVSPSVELLINGGNPIIKGSTFKIELINKRSAALEGQISISSPEGLFKPQSQSNPAEELIERNSFKVDLSPSQESLALVELHQNQALYDKKHTRALFLPSGEVSKQKEGDSYVISNGHITFKASPKYANALYSLSSGNKEWLASQYPKHEPYGWWNPFIGGIQLRPPNMNTATQQKEPTKAEFTEQQDNYGNIWTGIKSSQTIQEFEEHKGACYESYYLTLPGLPLLCHFFRYINNTGLFKEEETSIEAFLQPSKTLKTTKVEATDKYRTKYQMHPGVAEQELEFQGTAKITGDRQETLYIHQQSEHNQGSIYGDLHVLSLQITTTIATAPNKTHTSRPSFYLISKKNLPNKALADLDRIYF